MIRNNDVEFLTIVTCPVFEKSKNCQAHQPTIHATKPIANRVIAAAHTLLGVRGEYSYS